MESKLVKLHLACGIKYRDGWINVDMNRNVKADIYADLTKQLPFGDGSADLIYNEHFIEHISAYDGRGFIRECWRVLRPGGILRIATPDLQEIARDYLNGDWIKAAWLKEVPQGAIIETGAEYFNTAMRDWNHQFLYDHETLWSYLNDFGFKAERVSWNPAFETRIDSKLIMKATK